MYTVASFSESQDPGGVFVRMAAVPDQHVKTEGDGITIPAFNTLLGAHTNMGTLYGEVRLVSPSLRRLNPFYVTPVNNDIANANWAIHAVRPAANAVLDINELLECEESSNPAAAEQHTVTVFLSPGAIVPVEGKIFTANAEVTLAQVVSQWTFSEIDFVDELPVGRYAVVGASMVCSGGCVFRFVPVGEAWRPGAPISEIPNEPLLDLFRGGKMGEWFQFDSVQPPGLEMIGSAAVASATYQIYIDLMPL